MGWNPLSWFRKPEPPKKKKICCACPETKARRWGAGRAGAGWYAAHAIPHLMPLPMLLRRPASAGMHCPAPAIPTCRASHTSAPRPPGVATWVQKARDECTSTYGPEDSRCAPLIEAHKQCLRKEGFNVRRLGAGCSRVLGADVQNC